MVISSIVDMNVGGLAVCSPLYKITILCDYHFFKYYLTHIDSHNYVGGIILN